jgi:hypothetical protein
MPTDQIFDIDNGYASKVCNRLRVFREESGLPASAVAEHLHIPTALYVIYEEYELVPHRLIPPLCELLNLSPWFYLTGKSDAHSPPFRSEKRLADQPVTDLSHSRPRKEPPPKM